MKFYPTKLFYYLPLFITSASMSLAQDTFIDVEWDYAGDGTTWDDPSAWRVIDKLTWRPSTVISGVPDDTSRVAIDKDLTLDTDRQVSSLLTSYGTPVRTLNLNGNSLTVDSLYGSDAFNIRSNSESVVGGLTVQGGDLYLTKTADKTKNMVDGKWDGTWTTVAKEVGTNTINLGLSENSYRGTNSKTITFASDSNVFSTENLQVNGYASTQSFVNIQGNLTAQYNDVYKSLAVYKTTLTIEEGADVKIGALTVGSNSIMNVNGALQVAPTDLAKDSNNVTVGAGSVLNINNKMILTASGTNTANMGISGTVNIAGAGELNTTGGYGNVNISNGGVLRLASGVGTFSCGSSIRLGGGGKVIFDAPDVWKDAGDGSNMRTFSLWMSSASNQADLKMSYIEVNAHTTFNGLAFGMNAEGKYGAQLTITFGDDPNAILDLKYLTVACDTNQGYLWNEDSKLVLVNFENGKIRMSEGLREASGDFYDNLDLISAEGFEDGSFRVEEWDDGYYYLVGTAVPEPAAFAAALSMLALAFAVYRRKAVK